MPLETPVTALYGEPPHGMTVGLRTELSIARAVDKTDLDPVAVHLLPAQERILDALFQLGFQFKGADLERGHVRGVHQQLPFYQEIEFCPPPHAQGITKIEVTFVASPLGMDVILEVDRRGGVFTGGHGAYGHLRVDYTTAAQVDWAAQINGWLRDTLATRPAGYGGHGMRSRGGYGHAHRGHGGRLGGVAAGAAAGFVGGMVAGEVLGEVFDDGEDFGFEE